MTLPVLIEVRYKPFNKLDYVSGYSHYFLVKELPTLTVLMTALTEELDEICIRMVPERDVEALAANLATEDEVEVQDDIDDRFFDIVGVEKPAELLDLYSEKTVEDAGYVVYSVVFSSNAAKALLEWWYHGR